MSAKIEGLKMKVDEVSQTVDLKDLFGASLTGNEALKQKIGQAMIDKIISRTESGTSVDGKNLKSPYSKRYAESDDFKAWGKTKRDINMKLTGQMLGTLDILETGGSKIVIGWSDKTENAKAYNHNTGDTVPKRNFFGLNKKDLEEIRNQFQDEVEEKSGKLQGEKDYVKSQILKRLNPRLFSSEG